jgi:hypothetical protein
VLSTEMYKKHFNAKKLKISKIRNIAERILKYFSIAYWIFAPNSFKQQR